MVSLEDASTRLLRPPKDLADWNCPFSEILEEYYTLVEKHQNVNLNKAALVVQNSANTYVRRVEYLFQDTTALVQSFVDQEAANESKKNTKKDGKEKKTVIDIIDFERIDFAQYIGKNNNIKQRSGVNNAVKLLGQRFPQLENTTRPSKAEHESSAETDQEQDNEQGVGRKYAFRCNQYITASGMLVEHLRPEGISKRSQSSSNRPSRESTESGVCSNDGEDNDLVSQILRRDSVVSDSHRAVSTPLPDTENDFMNASFVSAVDSGRGSSLRTTTRPESSLSSDRGENWDSFPTRPDSSLSISGFISPEPRNDSGICHDESPLSDFSPSKRSVDEPEISPNSESSDVSAKSDTPVVEQCRRSKRFRSLFDDVKTTDSRPLEAIPFDSVPDKLPKSRSEFKLPCAVSLLKCNDRPHKRKTGSETRKRRSLKKYFSSEADITNEKLSVYSASKQLFLPFVKEELDHFPKCLEKCLQSLRELTTLKNYEAIMDESMSLRGYKEQSVESIDSSEYETTSVTERQTPSAQETDAALEDFPMPDTPESFNGLEPMSPPPPTCESRIERLVHDIYENSDVRTEQEEAVARWHEDIQMKLKRDENRPKFEMAEYTSRVVKTLRNNDGRMTFDQMIRQNQPPEAARYLLASLMLANKYNVHIDPSNEEGDFTLLLLND